MKKRMLISLLGICLSFGALAQESGYAFRVLINKGKNEIKSGGSWLPAKVGSSIGSKDEIKVPENGYLGLVHVSGKSIELKEAKTYMVADLSAKMGQNSSVLNKYTDFIISNNTQKKGLVATGAVDRGTFKSINVFLPKLSPVVYNDKIIISWEKDKAPPPYIVTFRSLFEDELKKEEVNTNSITINLSDPSFENEDNFTVHVVPKAENGAKKSEPYTIKRLSKADKDRINKSLVDLKGIMLEETALNKQIMAAFYEQNGLLIDAATAYQEAIKLAPDVSQLQDEYNEFLIRHAIKPLPKKK